jgi:G3E family GTPase
MVADFGRIPIAEVLDLRGFNLNDKLEIDPAFLAEQEATHEHEHEHGHEQDHSHGHGHDHAGQHDQAHADDISAFMFKSDRPFNVARLDEMLGGLVQVYGPRLLRYKGVLWMDGSDRKIVFQGVHQTMGSDVGAPWADDEVRSSRMVFIGKNLPRETFIEGLEQCLV